MSCLCPLQGWLHGYGPKVHLSPLQQPQAAIEGSVAKVGPVRLAVWTPGVGTTKVELVLKGKMNDFGVNILLDCDFFIFVKIMFFPHECGGMIPAHHTKHKHIVLWVTLAQVGQAGPTGPEGSRW